MNYRTVKTEDRLPDYDREEGIYPPIHSVVVPALWEINTEGFHVISSFYDYTNEYWHINLIGYDPMKKGPVWWLEEIPEVSEEEIRNRCIEFAIYMKTEILKLSDLKDHTRWENIYKEWIAHR